MGNTPIAQTVLNSKRSVLDLIEQKANKEAEERAAKAKLKFPLLQGADSLENLLNQMVDQQNERYGLKDSDQNLLIDKDAGDDDDVSVSPEP